MHPHLLNEFKKLLPEWKTGELKNTLLVVALLLEEKTTNLWKLKGSVGKLLGNTGTDPRSHYQRLKRWLWSGASTERIWVGMLHASVSLLDKQSRCLIIDGSSWKWNGRTYHIMTLSLLYKGVSIPIWWQDLNKLGISSQAEREDMLENALKVLNLEGKVLLADREYIGCQWFTSLQQADIEMVIRLRKGNYQQQIEQKGQSVNKLENQARSRVGTVVWKRFSIGNADYYFVLKAFRRRGGKIDYLRLISSVPPASAVNYYSYRYRIESMFRHLKSNGFELESLHVQKAYKVQMMIAAVVVAYTLSVFYGLKSYSRKIKIKNHGYAQMSVFRYGLDQWQNHLQSFVVFLDFLIQFINQVLLKKEHENLLVNQNVP
ncbi:MAG: transposase [Cyclobacteriaceae bacterium]